MEAFVRRRLGHPAGSRTFARQRVGTEKSLYGHAVRGHVVVHLAMIHGRPGRGRVRRMTDRLLLRRSGRFRSRHRVTHPGVAHRGHPFAFPRPRRPRR